MVKHYCLLPIAYCLLPTAYCLDSTPAHGYRLRLPVLPLFTDICYPF